MLKKNRIWIICGVLTVVLILIFPEFVLNHPIPIFVAIGVAIVFYTNLLFRKTKK